MIIDVTGVTSGSSPYLIYLCDWSLNSCFFITGVTSIPPIVQIDSNYYFPGLQLLKVKIFDNDGCFEIIDAPCLPTPTSLPPPPPTPTPGCAPCLDVCTYWQINLGAGPCIFKLFDCNGNIVNIRFFGTAGTYYVESVLQPQPFNQNCGYQIINLGPCPTPTPTPSPTTTPAPTATPISGCVEYNLTNSGPNNITFNFTPCCLTFIYPVISPITIPPISNVKVCSTTIPTFPNTQPGGSVTVVYSCPCPTPVPPTATPVPNIVWEMIPCCKLPWTFELYPGGPYPQAFMSLLANSAPGTMVIGTDNLCYKIDKPAVTSLPNVYWDGNPPTNDDCNECTPAHPCPEPCYILTITNTGANNLTIWFHKCCTTNTYPATAPYNLNVSSSVSIITDVIPPVIYPTTPGQTISYTITNLGLYGGC